MPSSKHNLISKILWSCAAITFGIFTGAGVFSAAEILYKDVEYLLPRVFTVLLSGTIAQENVPEPAVLSDSPQVVVSGKTSSVSIPAHGKAIRVDLENGAVSLYEEGRAIKNFSAVAIPDIFSPWRIPQGTYTVQAREAKHYSPLAEDSFPAAVLFGDNGLIRAENGAEPAQNQRRTSAEERNAGHGAAVENVVLERNEDAGIILTPQDAQVLFEFADMATEIIILNEIPEDRALNYAEALREEGAASARAARVSARAAFAADIDTGEIFFEKLPDLVLPIASVSKLFTAVVAKEALPPEKIIRVSPQAFATYGGSGELSIGDEFSARELLYPLLIESSNDAAETLAEGVGRETFIAAMNALAEKDELSRTSFKDPSGLSFGNTSTAHDLFRFAQSLADEHRDILAISKTPSFEAPASGARQWSRMWRSNNEFVRGKNQYLIGTKDGYTDEAAQTTVSLFALPVSETKSRRIAVVLLGSRNREGDVLALLNESGKGTLYKKNGFSDSFRKKAEKYAREKEKESPEFRLAILGALHSADSPEDASRIFDDILYLKSYDAVFADTESIVADSGYNVVGENALRTPRGLLDGFLTLGVDVVNVANAHAGDWGRSAFGDNVRLLKENGFLVAGGSDGIADKWKPAIVKRGGVTVGFLGVSDAGPEWLSENDYLPSTLSAKDLLFSSRIRDAARVVDHLVVSVAFDDARDDATIRRELFARATIDAGARIVVGFYPSENPRREEYKGGVIFYGQKGLEPIKVIFDKKGMENVSIESPAESL